MCRWDEVSTGSAGIRFLTQADARRWLLVYKSSPSSMSDLREALQLFGGDSSVLRAMDQQVIDDLGWLMASGRVLVFPYKQDLPDQGQNFDPPPPPPAPPPVAKSRATVSSAPPPEETTLPRNTDADAMAATLVAAAAEGVPFCEICEKNKKAQREAAEATA